MMYLIIVFLLYISAQQRVLPVVWKSTRPRWWFAATVRLRGLPLRSSPHRVNRTSASFRMTSSSVTWNSGKHIRIATVFYLYWIPSSFWIVNCVSVFSNSISKCLPPYHWTSASGAFLNSMFCWQIARIDRKGPMDPQPSPHPFFDRKFNFTNSALHVCYKHAPAKTNLAHATF